MSPNSLTMHLLSSLPLNAAWTTSWKATARGTLSAPPTAKGEGPRLGARCGCRTGGGPDGGPPGESGRPDEGEEEPEWGRGRRGPMRVAGWLNPECPVELLVREEAEPVLSVR